MARTMARLKSSALSDPEFTGLCIGAHWLYWILLQQPRLSLVGCIDLLPERWARFARDATPEVIDALLAELEAERYIVIDRNTHELLIRSFTRHDLDPSRISAPTLKGLWGAWSGIMSATLRDRVVTDMPDELWAKAEEHAPPTAVQTRRSPPLEREPPSPPEWEPAPPYEPPTYSLLPPSKTIIIGTDTQEGPADETEDDDHRINRIVQETVDIIGRQRANRPDVAKPVPYAAKAALGIFENPVEAKLLASIRELAAAGMLPAYIAAEVEPPPKTLNAILDPARRASPEAQAAAKAAADESARKLEQDTANQLADDRAQPRLQGEALTGATADCRAALANSVKRNQEPT